MTVKICRPKKATKHSTFTTLRIKPEFLLAEKKEVNEEAKTNHHRQQQHHTKQNMI